MISPVRHKFWIEGNRFNGIPAFLKEQAWLFSDLKLDLQEDRGWVNTVVYATVTGPENQVRRYMSIVDAAVAEHCVY